MTFSSHLNSDSKVQTLLQYTLLPVQDLQVSKTVTALTPLLPSLDQGMKKKSTVCITSFFFSVHWRLTIQVSVLVSDLLNYCLAKKRKKFFILPGCRMQYKTLEAFGDSPNVTDF